MSGLRLLATLLVLLRPCVSSDAIIHSESSTESSISFVVNETYSDSPDCCRAELQLAASDDRLVRNVSESGGITQFTGLQSAKSYLLTIYQNDSSIFSTNISTNPRTPQLANQTDAAYESYISWNADEGVEFEVSWVDRTVRIPDPFFNFTGLDPGSTYPVQITAIFDHKESEALNLTVRTYPTYVENFDCDSAFDSLTLNFENPRNYSVKLCLQNESFALPSLDVDHLSPGSSYDFEVIVTAGNGRRIVRNESCATWSLPSGISVSANQTSAVISWNMDPPDSNVMFMLTCRMPCMINETVNQTQISLSGLIPGTQYQLQLVTLAGNHRSEPVDFNFTTDRNLRVPENFLVSEFNTTSITLRWSGTEYSDEFLLNCTIGCERWSTSIVTGSNYTVVELMPGKLYRFSLSQSYQSYSSNLSFVSTRTQLSGARIANLAVTPSNAIHFTISSLEGSQEIERMRIHVGVPDGTECIANSTLTNVSEPSLPLNESIPLDRLQSLGFTHGDQLCVTGEISSGQGTEHERSSPVTPQTVVLRPDPVSAHVCHDVTPDDHLTSDFALRFSWENPGTRFDHVALRLTGDGEERVNVTSGESFTYHDLSPGVVYSLEIWTESHSQQSETVTIECETDFHATEFQLAVTESNDVTLALVAPPPSENIAHWLEIAQLENCSLPSLGGNVLRIEINESSSQIPTNNLTPGLTYCAILETSSSTRPQLVKSTNQTLALFPQQPIISLGSVDQSAAGITVDFARTTNYTAIEYRLHAMGTDGDEVHLRGGRLEAGQEEVLAGLGAGKVHRVDVTVTGASGKTSNSSLLFQTTLSAPDVSVQSDQHTCTLSWPAVANQTVTGISINGTAYPGVQTDVQFPGLTPANLYTYTVTWTSAYLELVQAASATAQCHTQFGATPVQVSVSRGNGVTLTLLVEHEGARVTHQYAVRGGNCDEAVENELVFHPVPDNTFSPDFAFTNGGVYCAVVRTVSVHSNQSRSANSSVLLFPSNLTVTHSAEPVSARVNVSLDGTTVGADLTYHVTALWPNGSSSAVDGGPWPDESWEVVYGEMSFEVVPGTVYEVNITISGASGLTSSFSHQFQSPLPSDIPVDITPGVHSCTFRLLPAFTSTDVSVTSGHGTVTEGAVIDLLPHTQYLFAVSVLSRYLGFQTQSNLNFSCTTLQGVPAEPTITLAKLNSYLDQPADLVVRWTEPDPANGVIDRYDVSFLSSPVIQGAGRLENISGGVQVFDSGREMEYTFQQVIPNGYQTEVRVVVTTGGGANESSRSVSHLEVREPEPTVNGILLADIKSRAVVARTGVTLTLPCEDLFLHTWTLVGYVFLVSSLGFDTTAAPHPVGYAEVTDRSRFVYQTEEPFPLPPQCDSSREKRTSGESTWSYTVGDQSDCSNSTAACNPELPAGFRFDLTLRAFSDMTPGSELYSDLAMGSYSTAKQPEQSNLGLVLGILAGAAVLLIIAALLAAVFVFRRVGRRSPSPGGAALRRSTPLDPIAEFRRPIKFSDMESTIATLSLNNNAGFKEQFEHLRSVGPNLEKTIAIHPDNSPKNRYTNTIPYDRSIVNIKGGYINACWIKGLYSDQEYIATQGPLPGTENDFWQMIWEHEVRQVVMLTQCTEVRNGAVKNVCQQYWPSDYDAPVIKGDVVIQLVNEENGVAWLKRVFAIKLERYTADGTLESSHSRQLIQYHYQRWPDFGVTNWDHLEPFIGIVRNEVTRGLPLVVHCSAGVGRTGCFIAMDMFMQTVGRVDHFDITGTIAEMRLNRPLMVQSLDQFMFVHRACLALIASRHTRQSLHAVTPAASPVDADYVELEVKGDGDGGGGLVNRGFAASSSDVHQM